MLMFGMLGIIFTGYLDTNMHPESSMATDAQTMRIVDEETDI